jgi:hypothetical protein
MPEQSVIGLVSAARRCPMPERARHRETEASDKHHRRFDEMLLTVLSHDRLHTCGTCCLMMSAVFEVVSFSWSISFIKSFVLNKRDSLRFHRFKGAPRLRTKLG